MSAAQTLEHTEHIKHAGHGHDDHGGGKSNFGTYVGITMATLGVLLAFCAARVGAERTELVKSLVEQQNAHAKYQSQDVKHRVAVLTLQGMAAQINRGANLDPDEVLAVDATVDRYLEESKLAKEWVESYDPAIEAHVEAQEHYELGQLFAEIGIVIASVALLIKKKPAWFLSLGLGGAAIVITAMTWHSTTSAVDGAVGKIEQTGKAYRDRRTADKTTKAEDSLSEDMKKWAATVTAAPKPSEPAPAPAAPAPAAPAPTR